MSSPELEFKHCVLRRYSFAIMFYRNGHHKMATKKTNRRGLPIGMERMNTY
jgi:hypothetical protein